MNIKEYISELKRRNVFKAGIAYLVVAWIITQVAAIVLPTFNAPTYILKIILYALALGFPIWLIFSWIYEITPNGIKKTKNIKKENVKSRQTGQRLNRLIIVALSIAVILLLFKQFGKKESEVAIVKSKQPSNIIAVLPFLNTKPDIETDYLGFAIADQVIGSLIYLKNITVRPSSSIRKYEKQTSDAIEIGNELSVEYVLAGNYLKEENNIRLNLELIDISTKEIIWRERIEVDYKTAFELQDIVAEKVVKKLDIQFSTKELNRIKRDIPKDPLAYEYFLRSISYPRSIEGDKLAIEMIKKSIELDSLYAPSYDILGDRIHTLANYGLLSPEETKKAEKHYLKALELNPELMIALGNLALVYTETNRIEEAVELTRKMLDINPNNSNAIFTLSYIYRYAGMVKESVQKTDQALELDPKNPKFRSSVITYTFAEEYDKTFNVVGNFKETGFTIFQKGFAHLRLGNQEKALELFDRSLEFEPEGLTSLLIYAYKETFAGNTKNALKIMRQLEDYDLADAEPWYFFARIYAMIGDLKGTKRCLKRAVEGGFFNYPLIKKDKDFDFMRRDMEFQEILELAKQKHLAFKKRLF